MSLINWNNTISYIKMQLGASVNQLEVDEYKIVDIINTITMPEFCQYFKYVDRISYPSDQIVQIDNDYRLRFQIQNYDRQIYDIRHVYMPTNWMVAYSVYNNTDAVSAAVSNYSYSIAESMTPLRTFQFFRPDIIELDIPIGYGAPDNFVVEMGVSFNNPNEIEPSMYSQFKKLAAADVIDYVISLRTKFQQLTTPQGTINMDLSRLEQKAERLRNEAIQKLENTQPEMLWAWINP